MIIQSSEVSMSSKQSYQTKTEVKSSVTYTPCINLNGMAIVQKKETEENESTKNDSTSTGFLSSLNYYLDKNGNVAQTGEVEGSNSLAANAKVRMETLSYLLRMLLYNHIRGKDCSVSDIISDAMDNSNTFLITRENSYEYSESQEVEFNSTGTVRTEDGREINFSYGFSLSSSFTEKYEEINQCVTEISLTDPLVINLKGNPTTISDKKFYFDLDGDGSEEEISRIDSDSGFLAFDKNEDGIINDGSELFGTESGDGFKDLAAYDEDNNGWIDENDEIFSKLRIWTMDESGNTELYTLKEADVGAIYLAKCKTNFNSYDDKHELSQVIRSSGIYLKETTGQAMGIQHVDMAT